MIFLLGFSIFGSFTYSGTLMQKVTGYNILNVGLMLFFKLMSSLNFKPNPILTGTDEKSNI